MKSFTDQIYPIEPIRGMFIKVRERQHSFNSGADWHLVKTATTINPEDVFLEIQATSGPSESGFDGNCNHIFSGTFSESCRRYNGKKWVKIK